MPFYYFPGTALFCAGCGGKPRRGAGLKYASKTTKEPEGLLFGHGMKF